MWKTASLLVVIVLVLVTIGIVMLYSTSGIQGAALYRDPAFYLKRQLMFLGLGLAGAVAGSRINYHVWRWLALPLAALAVVLLVLVFVPGIGLTVNGSSRWLHLGPVNFQPSELGKFAAVALLAWWMARVQRRAYDFTLGLFIPLMFLGVILGLVFIEPDFGTTLLISAVGMAVMFVGGTQLGYLLIAGALGLVGFSLAVMQNAERMRRIIAFLNPEAYAKDEAFQLLNAIYAFVLGGGAGVGLGHSLQKQFYLPEAHTDFIFAIIGEELGVWASLLVVLLFVGFFVCGIRISFRAPDKFGLLLGFGLTLMITLQAAINIGVVTGSLPTKGLPLPFISYGGSSLVVYLCMVGVLVNIARHAGEESRPDDTPFVRDAAQRP